MSSSSDEEYGEIKVTRLGNCEVCGSSSAMYTCPKCEVKTCCLSCVRIHKKELECDGVRDRTKFIRVKDFTNTDLLSDYRLLEECARFVYGVKKNENKKFTRIEKDLPIHLYKLKGAARQRGTALQFLAQNFSRHKVNTTRYNFKANIINWRVEWVFPNVESNPLKFIDEKCSEQKRLSELLDKYLSPVVTTFEGSKALEFYKSVGFSGIRILLRAEKVKGSSHKFFELDPSETLAENLSGKCIVEFPIIFIVLKDHAYSFDVISPEDEFEYEQYDKNIGGKNSDNQSKDEKKSQEGDNFNKQEINITTDEKKFMPPSKKPRQLLTQKVAEKKKIEIEKEIKADRKRRPKNLLFTTGYSSEESLSESDNEENKNTRH